jgi:hypothetical protein
MNSTKKKEPKKILDIAKWFLILGVVLCIIMPIMLTLPAVDPIFNYSDTGEIGDTIGGITSPFVSLIGSILVFYALKAQIDANRLIQEQFDEQKADEIDRKRLVYITDQINILRTDINEFTYTFRQKNYKYNYTGSDGIYQFLKSIKIGDDHSLTEEEFKNQNPKINELIHLLKNFHNQIEIIQREKVSDYDRDYFFSLLEYLYNSKIRQPLEAYRKHKRSDQYICTGCGKKHGIPDEIFDENDKITSALNIKTGNNHHLSK